MKIKTNHIARYAMILAVSIYCISITAQGNEVGAKAGFAQIIITPEDVSGGSGYCSSYERVGVHDDLYACAAYFEKAEKKAIVISFDLSSLRGNLSDLIRSALVDKYGFESESVFLTSTHTHSGARAGDEYNDYLKNKVLEVTKEAIESAQEFDLGANFKMVDENLHRTFFLQDGTTLYTPHYKMLLPITSGHTDKQLYALFFFDKKGKLDPCQRQPYGVIVNYTVHPVITGHTRFISADFPGVIRKEIKESLACPSVYITGAAGDNHPKRPESGFAECERVGKKLASEVIMMRYDADFIPNEEISLDYIARTMPAKTISKEEYDAIPKAIHDSLKDWKFSDPPPVKDVEVGYSALELGPVCFFGVPGEWDSELGSALKWFSPFKRNIVMYYATSPGGYIMHPNNYAWGCRETYRPPFSYKYIRPLFNKMIDAAEELHNK